ncbi:MAG: thermonuclease family protein [Scytolyngbya sp. HA4215-MV1]|nr:thermonuclease family protein [Scytolyngbya sp. HA4215-MV1]
MKRNTLLNFAPIVATIGILAGVLLQQWQRFPESKPEGDRPFWTFPIGGSRPSGQSQLAQVVDVQDGDTLKVWLNGREERIRLCGVDAPELAQLLGGESRQYLRSLINQGDGTMIVLPVEQDRYGRTVAELFIKPRPGQGYRPEEEIAVNAQMVRDGYAYHYARYSDGCPNGGMLASLEAEAQQQRRGVWTNPSAVRPWDYRQSMK